MSPGAAAGAAAGAVAVGAIIGGIIAGSGDQQSKTTPPPPGGSWGEHRNEPAPSSGTWVKTPLAGPTSDSSSSPYISSGTVPAPPPKVTPLITEVTDKPPPIMTAAPDRKKGPGTSASAPPLVYNDPLTGQQVILDPGTVPDEYCKNIFKVFGRTVSILLLQPTPAR